MNEKSIINFVRDNLGKVSGKGWAIFIMLTFIALVVVVVFIGLKIFDSLVPKVKSADKLRDIYFPKPQRYL